MCKLQILFQLLAILLTPILSSCSWSSSHLPGYVRRHMNPAADACVDFYEHACGSWTEAHEERAYTSQFTQLDYVYHGRLATLLEQPPVENQPRFVQLLRDNYNACRKMQRHYKSAHFVRWLATWGNISLEQEMGTDMDYSKLRLLLRLNDSPTQQRESTSSLEEESEMEAVEWLRQLQLLWPAGEVYAAEFLPLTRVQFRHLYHALQPLGVSQRQLWQQVKQLEHRLSQLPHAGADAEAEAEADTEADGDAKKMVTEHIVLDHWLLPLPQHHHHGATMMSATSWTRYLHRVRKLLDRQSLPMLVRYGLLRLLHKLQLRPKPVFGRHECAAQSRHLLTHAAVWLLQQDQTEEQRQMMHATVQQLFEQLRQRFKLRLLSNRNDFGHATLLFLLNKLQRMRLRVGVLPKGDYVTQRQQLELHYARLQLNDSDYYGNLLATLRQIENWNQDRDRNEDQDEDGERDVATLQLLQSDGYGSHASPYFLPNRNLIVLPYSLLTAPLYRPHQATVLTQSAIGFLIAHEMSHGFSLTDVHYDGRGNVARGKQRSHIVKNSIFANQIRCLRLKYIDDIDEKFADINGISLAFEAFNVTSPAANSSLQQLFFLNYAQFFCQDDRRVEDSLVHGGSRQRVNDAVTSLDSFTRAFSCAGHKIDSCRLY